MLRRIVVFFFILVLIFFLIVVRGNRQLKRHMLDDQANLIALANDTSVSLLPVDSIPAPIQRYMAWAVTDSLIPIRLAHIQHAGYYGLIKNKGDRYVVDWKYLVAERWVVPHAFGFAWNAMMHLRWDFWTKCRYCMINGKTEKIWNWMGVFKYNYEPENTLDQNAVIHHIAGSMWVPTQLISNSALNVSTLDDTTVQVLYCSEKDTLSGIFIFEPKGRPKWFVTEDYLFDTGQGVHRVPWRVKYWQYFELNHYRLPSRMSASINLEGRWRDLNDLRLDQLECRY